MGCRNPKLGLESSDMNKSLTSVYAETYEFVMEGFKEPTLTYQDVADGSGVSRRTVEKVARREIENPGVETLQPLADYFRKHQRTRKAATL